MMIQEHVLVEPMSLVINVNFALRHTLVFQIVENVHVMLMDHMITIVILQLDNVSAMTTSLVKIVTHAMMVISSSPIAKNVDAVSMVLLTLLAMPMENVHASPTSLVTSVTNVLPNITISLPTV